MLNELILLQFSNYCFAKSIKRWVLNKSNAIEWIRLLNFDYVTMLIECLVACKLLTVSPNRMGAIDTAELDIEICKTELHEDTKITKSSNYYVNSK